MKQSTKLSLTGMFLTLILATGIQSATAQGTAFTYQGRLNSGTNPATGSYDISFALYIASSGGAPVGSPLTNSVVVSNGLFTVTLDFDGVFNGTPYWLQLGVRSNGVAAFIPLTQRQPLTPTPYAVYAETASATGLTGTVPSGNISGLYFNAVTLNNPGNNLSGNGAGLTALNAGNLASGTVADARLSTNVAFLNANQYFTGSNTFYRVPGKSALIVSADPTTSVPIETSLFTGLGFQYNPSSGEGALLSSYDDGFSSLGFYTKAGGGQPITKQLNIDQYGVVGIDPGNKNGGVLSSGGTNGAGLIFGTGGEGIASKRTAGGNQNGLDFYTGSLNRMSILANGFVGVNRTTQITGADYFGVRAPVTNAYGGMYIDTVGAGLPFYGYAEQGVARGWTYVDGNDGNKWKVNLNSGDRLTVTPAGNVGIGTTAPAAPLHVLNPTLSTVSTAAGIYSFTDGGSQNDVHPLGGFYTAAGEFSGPNGLIGAASTNQSSGYGVIGLASGSGGIGIYGSASSTSGSTAYGVYGLTASSNAAGVYAQGASTAGNALAIANGGIQVVGAGIASPTSVFIHVTSATNDLDANGTDINNPLCNNHPNAILVVTHNLSAVPGVNYHNHTLGVYYNVGRAKWEIFNEDNAAMPTNRAFNVWVANP